MDNIKQVREAFKDLLTRHGYEEKDGSWHWDAFNALADLERAVLLNDEALVEAVAIAQSQWVNGEKLDRPKYHELTDASKEAYKAQAKAAISAIQRHIKGM